MEITAKEVSRLRAMTGAGMMDCKKALTQVDGDFDKAIEELRKKGQKVSASRSGKETNEGGVFIQSAADHKEVVLIALNCETDFVVKNESFQRLGRDIASTALTQKIDSKEKLLQTVQEDHRVEDKITELVGKVGERIAVSRMVYMKGEHIGSYIHAGGKLGVLVSLSGGDGAVVADIARDLGMQIAAMNPLAIDEQGVDPTVVERERGIIKAQVEAEGKPEKVAEQITQGKLKKFFRDNTLLGQSFVKDSKQTVMQYLEGASKGIAVTDFCRVVIG